MTDLTANNVWHKNNTIKFNKQASQIKVGLQQTVKGSS